MQAQDGKKVGFGDLARELREMVYANILEDDRPVRKWGTHKFSPRSAIVFVSRQINKEYNETMRAAEASIPCALHRHIYDDKAYSRQDGTLLSKQAFDDAVYVPNNATRVLTTIHINAGLFKSATVRNPRPRIALTDLEDLVIAVGDRLCSYTGLEHVVISIELSNAIVVDFRRINITEFLYGAVKTIANRSRPQLQVLGVVLSGPVECFSRRAPDGGWVSDCGHGQKLMEVGDNRLDEALEDIRAPSDLLRAPKGFVSQAWCNRGPVSFPREDQPVVKDKSDLLSGFFN